jgi:hypothetical protein
LSFSCVANATTINFNNTTTSNLLTAAYSESGFNISSTGVFNGADFFLIGGESNENFNSKSYNQTDFYYNHRSTLTLTKSTGFFR